MAAKKRTTYKTDMATAIDTGGSNSAAEVRTVLADLADSALFPEDTFKDSSGEIRLDKRGPGRLYGRTSALTGDIVVSTTDAIYLGRVYIRHNDTSEPEITGAIKSDFRYVASADNVVIITNYGFAKVATTLAQGTVSTPNTGTGTALDLSNAAGTYYGTGATAQSATTYTLGTQVLGGVAWLIHNDDSEPDFTSAIKTDFNYRLNQKNVIKIWVADTTSGEEKVYVSTPYNDPYPSSSDHTASFAITASDYGKVFHVKAGNSTTVNVTLPETSDAQEAFSFTLDIYSLSDIGPGQVRILRTGSTDTFPAHEPDGSSLGYSKTDVAAIDAGTIRICKPGIYQVKAKGTEWRISRRESYPETARTVAGSTYTIDPCDHDRKLKFTGACTVTIPQDLPIGFETYPIKSGTGDVTFVAAAGVSLESEGANLTTQHSMAGLTITADNEAYLVGKLSA